MLVGGLVSLFHGDDEIRWRWNTANDCPGSAFSCEDNSGTTAS